MTELPQDIKAVWLPLIRRLQAAASGDNQGLAVISITILVDQDGNPHCWSAPRKTNIEPKRAASDILHLLGH